MKIVEIGRNSLLLLALAGLVATLFAGGWLLLSPGTFRPNTLELFGWSIAAVCFLALCRVLSKE